MSLKVHRTCQIYVHFSTVMSDANHNQVNAELLNGWTLLDFMQIEECGKLKEHNIPQKVDCENKTILKVTQDDL